MLFPTKLGEHAKLVNNRFLKNIVSFNRSDAAVTDGVPVSGSHHRF
jgi:hypothetical protein